jgi:hypothetical protein
MLRSPEDGFSGLISDLSENDRHRRTRVAVTTRGSKSKKVPELCHRRLPSTPEKVLLDFRKG